MSLTTLNDIFFAAADRNLDRAMLHRRQGKWQRISSSDLRRNVAGTTQPQTDRGTPHYAVDHHAEHNL